MNTEKQFDVLVFIARMQPLHLGHIDVLKRAASLARKVVVLIGSVNQPRTIKNPFTFAERHLILNTAIADIDEYLDEFKDVELAVLPRADFKSDDNVWASNVQRDVAAEVIKMGWIDGIRKVGLIGHTKDESSFYLKLFPQWDLVEHDMNEIVSATDIRKLYFESNIKYIKSVVPRSTFDFLEQFKLGTAYKQLVEENEFINGYKKSWESAPYAPTFVTADSVVFQSGHVLLIKRKASPGKGLWALPGGFVNQTERVEAAALRELREETGIKVPLPVLKGSITKSAIFDTPDRSLRGRTITHAFLIELPAGKLPAVKGNDDAEKAKWVPLSHVREEEMFEDHFHVIQKFIGQLN